MRIALISDIHGNAVAFEAVLADLQRAQPDQVICLGDVATLGPQPRHVLAQLKALGCPCVMGNHDSALLHLDAIRNYIVLPGVEETVRWCARQLAPADLVYIGSFQPSLTLSAGDGASLLCFHGSPQSNTDLILAETPAGELEKLLAGATATVQAGGHTHIQMLRRHRDVLVVNPGSVGAPWEQIPFYGRPARVLPWAEYALVEWIDGVLRVDLRRVPFDVQAAKDAVLSSDMPAWIKDWVRDHWWTVGSRDQTDT